MYVLLQCTASYICKYCVTCKRMNATSINLQFDKLYLDVYTQFMSINSNKHCCWTVSPLYRHTYRGWPQWKSHLTKWLVPNYENSNGGHVTNPIVPADYAMITVSVWWISWLSGAIYQPVCWQFLHFRSRKKLMHQ
jgi:hypothetical protein